MVGLKFPKPPLQTPLEATVILPFNKTAELFVQTEMSGPAVATGAGVKLNCIWSSTGVQFPVDVNVNVIVPNEISAGLGT